MTEPLVPDHPPTDWTTAIDEFLHESTWRTLTEMREHAGLERIRYVIVPEPIFDAMTTADMLDEEGRWLCPTEYWVTVLVADRWV